MNVLKIPTKDDAVMNLIRKEYGLKGCAVAINIMKEIVFGGGSFKCTDATISFLAKENEYCGASAGLIQQVVKHGIKTGLFKLSDDALMFGDESGRIGKLNTERK